VTARFIREHQGALLIGPPGGVGKSHAAVAIAVGAIRAGYHAFVRSAFDLAQDFAEAGAAGERRAFVQRLTTVDLLVLEDFGIVHEKEKAKTLAHMRRRTRYSPSRLSGRFSNVPQWPHFNVR
jgi:DNA replication protein DnaC